MDPISLTVTQTVYSTYCTFAGSGISSLNANQWINITAIVLGINFAVAAAIFAISGVMPTAFREKLKAAAKYEAFQGMISVVILAVLIGSASTMCNIGQMLVSGSTVQHYQNPLQYSQFYVNNLMFNTGLNLFTSIYSESVLLTLTGNIANYLEEFLPTITITPALGFSFSAGLMGIYFGFSGAMTGTFLALIAVTFGVLFMVLLILPFIQQLAFTILLPLALVMRSIPFAGPNLRQTSDTFLALAVGFYLIFPLTILFNAFVVTWVFTPCSGAVSPALCNPYYQYSGPYQIYNLPSDALFSTNTQQLSGNGGFLGGFNLFSTFYGGSFNGLGGLGNGVKLILENLYGLPGIIIGYAQQTAQYLFQGIFLIGLDFAITVGFAMGLSKGLNSVGRMIGVGPFWGK